MSALHGSISLRGKSPRFLVLFILALGLLIATVGVAAIVRQFPERSTEMWLEVGKAALQLGLVVVVGGIVTGLLPIYLESVRRREERLEEHRRQVFLDLLAAYNRLKGVRRTLRASGLGTVSEPLSPD